MRRLVDSLILALVAYTLIVPIMRSLSDDPATLAEEPARHAQGATLDEAPAAAELPTTASLRMPASHDAEAPTIAVTDGEDQLDEEQGEPTSDPAPSQLARPAAFQPRRKSGRPPILDLGPLD